MQTMDRAGHRRIREVLGLALVLAVVVVAWRSNYLAAMQVNPTVALQSAGIAVLCLWTADRLQMGLCVVGALALRLLVHIEVHYFAGNVIAVLGLFGFCGFCLLVYRWVTGEQLLRILLPAMIFSTAGIMLTSLLLVATKATTRRYDLEIYAIDHAVWDGAGQFFGRVTLAHQWLLNVENIIYAALPFAMILVFAFYTYRRPELANDLLVLYLSMGILGYLLYFVVPACGPIYAFGSDFPLSLPPVERARLANHVLQNAPNAMPSLHFANALMLYLNSKTWWSLRVFTLVFMILTAIATLGSGEHYVTDLVVAVPFAIAFQALLGPETRKFGAAVVSIFLVCIWLAIVKGGSVGAPHWLLWALTAATLACPVLLAGASWGPTLVGAKPSRNADQLLRD